MPHPEKMETVRGRLQRLLFSPKGSIEGLLISTGTTTVQVSIDHFDFDAGRLNQAVGKPVELKARADSSHKTKGGAHPVYKLGNIVKIGGKVPSRDLEAKSISGIVAAIHYAKHGEPNGVILESGEFIHTRPPGMKKLRLEVGSKIVARGETRITLLGTRMLEARQINQVALE